MHPLQQQQLQALFRHQKNGVLWTGGVHMMNKFYEYVPFALNNIRYMMAFYYPAYLNNITQYSKLLYQTKGGGIFIPQREHRMVKLFAVGTQGELSTMPAIPAQARELAQALYQVVITYCQSSSLAGQFFFQAEPAFGKFIRTELPKLQKGSLSMVFHDELAEPFYGFSLSFKTII